MGNCVASMNAAGGDRTGRICNVDFCAFCSARRGNYSRGIRAVEIQKNGFHKKQSVQ